MFASETRFSAPFWYGGPCDPDPAGRRPRITVRTC